MHRRYVHMCRGLTVMHVTCAGSNIFNIFMCLGFPWLLYCAVKQKPYESAALASNIIIPIALLFL